MGELTWNWQHHKQLAKSQKYRQKTGFFPPKCLFQWACPFKNGRLLNTDETSLLRRLQGQILPDEALPVGKIHPFSKIAVTALQDLESLKKIVNIICFMIGSIISNHLAVTASYRYFNLRMNQWMNQWLNDRGVCRAAPREKIQIRKKKKKKKIYIYIYINYLL